MTRSSSARARTAWRPRSPSPGRGAPCSCSRRPATIGGGTRTAELTLPGYRHDVCSADPPARARVAVPARAAAGAPRALVRAPRDPARAPARRRLGRRAAAIGGRRPPRRLGPDARGLPAAHRPARSRLASARPTTCLRRCGVPRHPLALARFGRAGVRSATGLARGRFDGRARTGAARGQSRRTRSGRSRARDRRPSACCSRCSATASAGPRAAAARRRSRTRWPRCCASSAARSRTGSEVRSLADVRGARGRAARRHAAPAARHRRRRAPAALPPRARALPLRARASSSSTARSTGRSRGRAPECRAGGHGAPRRRRWRRSRAASAAVAAAGTPSGRSCSSRSRASSTPRARPRASTRCGRTATCRTARRVDMTTRDRAPDRALRPGLRRAGPRARAPWARRARGAQRRTTSAATSTAARPTCGSSSRGPCRGSCPYSTPDRAPLPLLGVDAARRGRAWHVRGTTPPARHCEPSCADGGASASHTPITTRQMLRGHSHPPVSAPTCR